MSDILIRHKTNRGLVLRCDEAYNPLSEQKIGAGNPRSKAFYVRFPGGFIGVYSSVAGPVLFINEEKYLFSDESWSISTRKIDAVNRIEFEGLRNGRLTFEYPAVKLDPLDPWSEEQFDDFFIWLLTKRNDREIRTIWTDKS